MRRHASMPLYAAVVITLLLSVLSPMVMAQPAPNPCSEGQVYLPDQKVCVPEGEVPPDDGSGQPTEPEEPTVPAVPAGDLASLTLYHLACDDDFEADAVRDAGGIGPANGCVTFGKPPFTYTIAANQIPILTTTLDATERNFVRLDVPSPVPAGTLTITVAPVETYTTEFISCGLSIGNGFRDIVEPSIAGGSATLTTEPDQDVECWVYNVTRETSEQGDSEGVVAEPEESAATGITIATYYCPAGTVATDDLIAACDQRASGLTFSLVTATETIATLTTDAAGDVYFANVAANNYGIAATLPAGYGEPIVVCYHAYPNGSVEEGAEDIVFGNQFRFTVFGDGESLECAWYNVPAQGADTGPNIFIEARTCRAGTSISASMGVFDAQALCPDFYVDLPFQVLNVDQVIATGRTNVQQFSAGQVFFTKLPEPASGAFGVTAGVREGERTLAVYCDQDFGNGVFEIIPVRVSGDRMDQELGMGAGDTLRCTWFIEMSPLMTGTHAPDAPVQEAATVVEPGVILVARLCNSGADLTQADLDAACPTVGSGITFNVDASGEPYISTTTNTEGVIDVPLPVGDATFTITPQVPTGYGLPGYLCVSIQPGGGGGGKVVSLTADTPFHDLAWASDSEATCTYYFPVVAEDEAGDALQGIVAEDQAAEDDPAPEGTGDEADPNVTAEQEAVGEGDAENEAAGEPGLTVLARRCPPEAAGSDEMLAELCTNPASGLTFEILVDDEPIGTSVTDTNGDLAIPAEAVPGMYLFRHQPATDLLELRTECASLYPNGATASAQSSAAGSQMDEIYLSYDGASRVTCTFYFVMDSAAPQTGDSAEVTEGNVPPEDQATGDEANSEDGNTTGSHRFTLQFWTCPDGIDPAADQAVLEQACSVETGERSLMLTIDNHTTGETITGATTWEFNDPTVYADIGTGPISSAWCDSSWTGGSEDAAVAQDTVSLEGGALTVAVTHPATTVSCDWFIFPN